MATQTTTGVVRYALRCNRGPAKGCWWTGGGQIAHGRDRTEVEGAKDEAERILGPKRYNQGTA